MPTLTKEQKKQQDFLIRKEKFEKELNELFNKYHVNLSVAVEPVNFLAKSLKKLIRISWRLIVIDSAAQQ